MKNSPLTWILTGLILLSLSCQPLGDLELTLTQEPTATPRSWPFSTFVPPRNRTQVTVKQPTEIISSHLGLAKIESFDIQVNGQPLLGEATPQAEPIFPGRLIEVELAPDRLADRFQLAAERTANSTGLIDIVRVNPASAGPKTDRDLALIWVGHVPGRYVLTITATDETGKQGNTIRQQVEVR